MTLKRSWPNWYDRVLQSCAVLDVSEMQALYCHSTAWRLLPDAVPRGVSAQTEAARRGLRSWSGALIDDDILHPAHFVENAAPSVPLILGMDAPVVAVGQELV